MSKYTILLVDDEPSILTSLYRVFRKEEYEVLISDDPLEALDILKERNVHLIMSDYRMPTLDGITFLRNAMKLQPDAVRIVLSGYAESSVIIAAINDGGIYKFITKPWEDDLLKVEVRHALERYELGSTNRRLLEDIKRQNEELKNINQLLSEKINEIQESILCTIEMLSYILKTKNHKLPTNIEEIDRVSLKVAHKLGLTAEETKALCIAAKLNDLGNIGIDSGILNKPEKLTPEERKEVEQHPVIGETILSFLKGFESVSRVIRHHHENYDGSGYPDGLKGEDIPVIARIIHLLDVYDALISHRPYRPAMEYLDVKRILLESKGKKFDPEILDIFIDVLEGREEESGPDIIEIAVNELKEGMVLASDIKTEKGLLLIASGEVIQPSHISKIRNFQRTDPVVTRISIARGENHEQEVRG